jgi:hypothetical protein
MLCRRLRSVPAGVILSQYGPGTAHDGTEISDVDVEKARYILPWKSYWDLRELNASSADLVSQDLVDTAWKICCSFYGTDASEAAVQSVLAGLADGLSLDQAAERALPSPPEGEG